MADPPHRKAGVKVASVQTSSRTSSNQESRMTCLVLADHDNATLRDATRGPSAPRSKLDADVHVLVAGAGCRPAAEAAARLAGVRKVLLADAPAYDHLLAEPVAALVVSLAPAYGALLAPSTSVGRDVMPRVAALLDVMQVSDMIAVLGPDTFERPVFAGNVIETVRSRDAKKVITCAPARSRPSAPAIRRPSSRWRRWRTRATRSSCRRTCPSSSGRS
jgi:electron transfer flavoprotein alpha subunit